MRKAIGKVQALILKCRIGIKIEILGKLRQTSTRRGAAIARSYYTKAVGCEYTDSGSFALFSLMKHRHA